MLILMPIHRDMRPAWLMYDDPDWDSPLFPNMTIRPDMDTATRAEHLIRLCQPLTGRDTVTLRWSNHAPNMTASHAATCTTGGGWTRRSDGFPQAGGCSRSPT